MSNGEISGEDLSASGLDAFAGIEQSVLDAIPTGLCVCAADGVLVRFNRRAIELWGRSPRLGDRAELYGDAFRRFSADGSPLPFGSTPVATALRTGERLIGAELVIARPDGSRMPVLMTVAPIKHPSGRIEGAVCSFQELTERKRAEEALRASQAELQSIINSTPFMLVRCGRDLRYRFISAAYARLIGHGQEEVVGLSIAEIIGEEGFESIRPYIEIVLRGQPVEFECDVAFPGAGTRSLHIAYRPEMDAAGNVDGWIASLRDITRRRRTNVLLARQAAEQAALYQFTDRLYRAASLTDIYEAALDAIIAALHCDRASILRCDGDGGGIMRFTAWRGLSDEYRNAVEGNSPWQAGEPNPEPVCLNDVDQAELSDALRSAVQKENIRALAFIPLMTAGKLVGKFMAYYTATHTWSREDIDLALTLSRQLGFGIERMRAESARSRMEEELRRLSERLSVEVESRTLERDRIWNVSEDLFGVTNFEGYFLSLNPAWTRLLGWSEEEIKSMHVSELRHPDDAAHSIAGRRQLAQGVPTVRMENRFHHKDGSWRWLQWTMTENNGLIYVAGRHVTAEKEAAAALEQAQLRAAHLQKMEAIGQLTGGIAHDFNNLLMIVSGHAQRLKSRLPDAKDARALQAIQMAASRGENLTRQLLSFSRTLPLDPTVISLAEAVNGLRDVLAGSLHVNIQLIIDIPNATWPVRVDKPELELALVNLAVNARDAMRDGGRLSISAENVCLNEGDTPEGLTGEAVALTVADTGAGIPPEILSKVVEPFFTTKGPDKGTGLGLSQVYGFARRSGGTMEIASETGRGATVTIYLPRSRAAVLVNSPEDTAQYMAVGQKTILAVEDNEEVRNVAVSLLEQLGYRTIAVEDADAALDVLRSRQDIDLLFSDVVLPGRTDGVALGREISGRYPHIPVVLTTGYSQVFDTAPEFPVLRKPYQVSALGRVLHEALNSSPARRPAMVN
jgi:PAS domain S-box-containing protein